MVSENSNSRSIVSHSLLTSASSGDIDLFQYKENIKSRHGLELYPDIT